MFIVRIAIGLSILAFVWFSIGWWVKKYFFGGKIK